MKRLRYSTKKRPLVVSQTPGEDFLGEMNVEKIITNREITDGEEKKYWLKIRSIQIEKQEPFWLIIQQHDYSQAF